MLTSDANVIPVAGAGVAGVAEDAGLAGEVAGEAVAAGVVGGVEVAEVAGVSVFVLAELADYYFLASVGLACPSATFDA